MRHVRKVKTIFLKRHLTKTNEEGGRSSSYDDKAIEIQANVYPAGGNMDLLIYGYKANDMLNMLYAGNVELKPLDGLCINVPATSKPDYKIVLISDYSKHQAIKLERL